MLQCPACCHRLIKNIDIYCCQNQHSYDIAKDGYVNLHLVQHKHSKSPGDSDEAVLARRRFLSEGFYAPLKNDVAQIIANLNHAKQGLLALDIGCGEVIIQKVY